VLLQFGFRYGFLASSTSDRGSTLGCCFSLGSGMVSLFSEKQASMALRSTEALHMANSSTSCEAIWLRKLLAKLTKSNFGHYHDLL
jgi:hypothetical protein